MTNLELDAKFQSLVKTERKITREILDLIHLAEQQRLPQERGFKDTYDWLIRGHGYSGGAANRRIQASRLLKDVPEIAKQVEDGSLNLTTLWQTQKAIRAQQKACGQKISTSEKRAALKKVEGKTSQAAERAVAMLIRKQSELVQVGTNLKSITSIHEQKAAPTIPLICALSAVDITNGWLKKN